ncbi:hypothetical protein GCM10027174_03330 [Salinifilum aidingensis]
MTEQVRLLPLGGHEYAAEVHEAGETTEHRVVGAQEVRDSLDLPEEDEERFVTESLRYLLQERPVTALPHDIDLKRVHQDDPEFLPEMRSRISE